MTELALYKSAIVAYFSGNAEPLKALKRKLVRVCSCGQVVPVGRKDDHVGWVDKVVAPGDRAGKAARACIVCGVLFVGDPRAKLCSDACRAARMREHVRAFAERQRGAKREVGL
jgi:hypothetical protein